ncbi:kinase-like protein [Pilatotrama ljubarskyi]|nr:kinase-like protein [Pilatotrama ljubarskyi]
MDNSGMATNSFPDIQSVKVMIGKGRTLSTDPKASVVEIDDLIIKFGRRVYRSEALAMQLVRDKTTVPVPRLYAYFSELSSGGEERCGYLVMEKVSGVSLLDVLARLDEASGISIASQLRSHICSLRSLSSPGKWGVVGRDGVFHGGQFKYLHRPFTEEQLRYGNPCRVSSTRDVVEYFARACDYAEGDRDPEITIFSHGDLVPENILVDEATASITSIIDWEHAGWYPYFWDDSIAEMHKSAYQGHFTTIKRWNGIRQIAIEDASDREAVLAYTKLHFFAFLRGQDEFLHPA